jgi:hypothetical protein
VEPVPDLRLAVELLVDLSGKGVVPPSYSRLRPISADPATLVDDKPLSALVLGPGGRPLAVLVLSNSQYPDLVKQQLDGAAVARSALSPALRERILSPVATGFESGRSFAVWPLRRPLSANHLRLGIEKRQLASPVLSWLRAVAVHTRVELDAADTASLYAEPLFRMAEDIDLDPGLRKAAGVGLTLLDSGDWKPQAVLSHNDLWMGNVLVGTVPLSGLIFPRRFSIIDWVGSSRMGYPFFDTYLFAESIGHSGGTLRQDLVSCCEELGMPLRHVPGYLCAALGALALKADCFPGPRLISLCNRVAQGMQRAGLISGS